MVTETNFVVTAGFTTEVDHQTTSKHGGNNEICLGIHFCLAIVVKELCCGKELW